MPSRPRSPGRHRLGADALVHCTEFSPVAAALAEHRRSWLTALLVPARHSLAGLRRRSIAPELWWAPATLA
ncbi:hypothetical protein RHODO2019_09430 [Rhodococcus antarcticus]|jgi:hypothetical protein|uniref:Uncharacterized protein n=1 Tax=Rhodococcus antarcticus TaxID=2987751 RepID=A0ABY6NVN6_9NOCA|nr:hypothetical protein [Rhodococcus antarcticus]UZJ23457.1 hypothetical protein RHODO2019_09430 [Rhodococcus antarcticus]